MNKFHGRWVTGLVFIFLDINIVIDWLPDFVGWMFIAAAFAGVKGESAVWGKWASIMASILSLPLALHYISTLPESEIPSWLDVIFSMGLFAEFLAYAAFFMVSDMLLEREKRSVFSSVYLTFLLVWILWRHVYMHFPPNDAENTMLILGLLGIVLMICFIIQVFLRNREWKRKMRMEEQVVAAAVETGE